MRTRKVILVYLWILIPVFFASAQKGYKIVLNIGGMNDSVVFLANYFGDKTYLADTAFRSGSGQYVFEGTEKLPGGIYIVAGQSNNKYFEMLVNDSQFFTISGMTPDIFSTLQFQNSPENVSFYEFIRFSVAMQKSLEPLNELMKRYSDAPDSINSLKKSVDLIRKEAEDFRDEMINRNPGTFLSVLLRAMKEPEVPALKGSDGSKADSVAMYSLYKDHYWDQFDVADDRLLRTPLYHKRLENYFNRVVMQHPDTLISKIDKFIAKVEGNDETFKYVVWYLTYQFETSMIMGFDEIFVHMVDMYYNPEKAFWADAVVLESLKKRADALRKILIGATAPNLIIMDTAGSFISMHHQKAPFMVLIFYELGCGHCTREMEELKSWMFSDTLEISVFAVNTDTSLTKWKNYIVENEFPFIHANATRTITPRYHDLYDIRSTPTLFLLDKQKKIIAKRINVSQMIPFLQHYIRRKDM